MLIGARDRRVQHAAVEHRRRDARRDDRSEATRVHEVFETRNHGRRGLDEDALGPGLLEVEAGTEWNGQARRTVTLRLGNRERSVDRLDDDAGLAFDGDDLADGLVGDESARLAVRLQDVLELLLLRSKHSDLLFEFVFLSFPHLDLLQQSLGQVFATLSASSGGLLVPLASHDETLTFRRRQAVVVVLHVALSLPLDVLDFVVVVVIEGDGASSGGHVSGLHSLFGCRLVFFVVVFFKVFRVRLFRRFFFNFEEECRCRFGFDWSHNCCGSSAVKIAFVA